MSKKPIHLSQDEMALIIMIRRYSYQEVAIQVQDGVVTSVNQILKHRRKGGGLVFSKPNTVGIQPGKPVQLTADEAVILSKLREKPFQQLTIFVVNNHIESINQTLKLRRGSF